MTKYIQLTAIVEELLRLKCSLYLAILGSCEIRCQYFNSLLALTLSLLNLCLKSRLKQGYTAH